MVHFGFLELVELVLRPVLGPVLREPEVLGEPKVLREPKVLEM